MRTACPEWLGSLSQMQCWYWHPCNDEKFMHLMRRYFCLTSFKTGKKTPVWVFSLARLMSWDFCIRLGWMKVTVLMQGWQGMICCPLVFDHAVESHLCHCINNFIPKKVILSDVFKIQDKNLIRAIFKSSHKITIKHYHNEMSDKNTENLKECLVNNNCNFSASLVRYLCFTSDCTTFKIEELKRSINIHYM